MRETSLHLLIFAFPQKLTTTTKHRWLVFDSEGLYLFSGYVGPFASIDFSLLSNLTQQAIMRQANSTAHDGLLIAPAVIGSGECVVDS